MQWSALIERRNYKSKPEKLLNYVCNLGQQIKIMIIYCWLQSHLGVDQVETKPQDAHRTSFVLGVLSQSFIKTSFTVKRGAKGRVIGANIRTLNSLTTDDAFWCHQFLATCYQLAQSVLKIVSAVAERVGQGEVGGCTTLADTAWRPLQLPVEKPWSMPGGPFVSFLAQTGVENAPFTL